MGASRVGKRAGRGREDFPPRVLKGLEAAARRAARGAYAPYSGFRVGAALLDERGAIVTGANVENASYPLGVCAERAAILAWRAAEGARLAAVVIHTETDAPTSPCGLCREALCRWADAAAIYLSCRAGLSGPFRAGHWLPAARHGTRR